MPNENRSLITRTWGMVRTAAGMTAQAIKERIATPAKTSRYEPTPQHPMWNQARDLPLFNYIWIRQMLCDPTIRLALAMREAPLHSVEFAYKEGEEWVPGIKASSDAVAAWVLRTLDAIWRDDLSHILTDQIWGWSGGEVLWKLSGSNMLEYNGLLPRRAEDLRCRVLNGELCGVQVRNVKDSGVEELDFPRCLFTAYNPEPAEFYSMPALEGAFSPWADKCLNGGALDVRRLFMHKDAYGGMSVGYPDRTYMIGDKLIPARDLAREIAEQRKSGGVTTHPTGSDDQGNPLWEIKEATVSSNPQHILQYPKDLDTEQFRGLEIPDDVLESTEGAGGAWAGKTVPMQAFYNGREKHLRRKIRDIKHQLLEPGVLLNFGPGHWFEVSTKPLALQAMEQQGEKKAPGEQQGPSMFMPPQYGGGGGGGGRQQPPARMGLDPVEAVAAGAMSAAGIVKAARMALDMPVVAIPETHEFSCALFNLPADLAYEVRKLGELIPWDDLAEDGRELNPHVTVKFGLHTDNAEDVRRSIQGEPPVGIQFGKTSCFTGEQYDVVKIEIEGKAIRQLNQAISDSLPHTDTHPDYKPHVTIAYVKPGLGEHYASLLNSLEGRAAIFDRLTFSDKQRRHISIPLLGKATRLSINA